MDSSRIETEIETKALEKRFFTNFDMINLDLYFNMSFTMKAQTDNLYAGNQRPLKDLAILYKRFSVGVNDLINKVTPSKSGLSADNKRKLELLLKESNSADKSYLEIIAKIKN